MLALNPNKQTCIGKEEDASPQPKQTKLLNASRPHSKLEQTLMGADTSPQPKETNKQNIGVQQFLFLIILVRTLCLEQ